MDEPTEGSSQLKDQDEQMQSRFKTVDDEELDELELNIISESTKAQTKWAVKIFQGNH